MSPTAIWEGNCILSRLSKERLNQCSLMDYWLQNLLFSAMWGGSHKDKNLKSPDNKILLYLTEIYIMPQVFAWTSLFDVTRNWSSIAGELLTSGGEESSGLVSHWVHLWNIHMLLLFFFSKLSIECVWIMLIFVASNPRNLWHKVWRQCPGGTMGFLPHTHHTK